MKTSWNRSAEDTPEKPKPYITPGGTLVIPFDSDPKYHWWRGGQSVSQTRKEVETMNQKNQKVGIFWVHRRKLLAASFALDEADSGPTSIDAPVTHADHWTVLQRGNVGLRDLEYFQVPRGRVLFSKTQNKFCVYMDQTLHKRWVKEAILKQFGLAAPDVEFLTDPHYTTDLEEIDRMMQK